MRRRARPQRAPGGRGPLFLAAARRAAVGVRRPDCRRDSGARPRSRPATPTRTRCRTSGTTIRSALKRPAPRSRTRSSGSWRSSATATACTRRGCREVMEFAGARRRTGARDRRRHGHRPRAVREARRARHRRRSVDGHLQLAQENFRLRGSDRPVRSPRRRDRCRSTTTPSTCVYSNGVLHHTPNTGARRRRNLPRAEAGRPGDRDGLRRELAAVLAESRVALRSEERRPREPIDGRDHVAHGRANRQRCPPAGEGLHQAAAAALCSATSPTSRSCSGRSRPSSCRAGCGWLLPLVERLAGWNLIIKATKPARRDAAG